MTTYNLTQIVAANTTLDQITAVDQVITGGWFSTFMIMSLWVILVMSFYREGWGISVMGSSFICSIITILMWGAGIVNLYVTVSMMVITLISTAAIFFTNK